MKPKWKVVVVSGVAAVALVLIFWCVVEINAKKDRSVSDNAISVSDSAVLTWVDSFTKRDFNACDLLVENQNYRLYSPLVITQSRDRRYYDKVLNSVVNCIHSVSLMSVEDDTYKLKVSIVPYEPVSDYDIGDLSDLRGRFINGTIGDSDFTSALEQLYYEAFLESCFLVGNENVDIIVELSESVVDGITYVYGTVDFVDLILQESGLSANFAVYENSIKSEIDALLKLGVDE